MKKPEFKIKSYNSTDTPPMIPSLVGSSSLILTNNLKFLRLFSATFTLRSVLKLKSGFRLLFYTADFGGFFVVKLSDKNTRQYGSDFPIQSEFLSFRALGILILSTP